MGIAGLTSAAFMVLAGLGGDAAGLVSGDPMAMVLLVAYPLAALLYVFPSMHLVRSAKAFASSPRLAIRGNSRPPWRRKEPSGNSSGFSPSFHSQ